jgi:hypothetical protein
MEPQLSEDEPTRRNYNYLALSLRIRSMTGTGKSDVLLARNGGTRLGRRVPPTPAPRNPPPTRPDKLGTRRVRRGAASLKSSSSHLDVYAN